MENSDQHLEDPADFRSPVPSIWLSRRTMNMHRWFRKEPVCWSSISMSDRCWKRLYIEGWISEAAHLRQSLRNFCECINSMPGRLHRIKSWPFPDCKHVQCSMFVSRIGMLTLPISLKTSSPAPSCMINWSTESGLGTHEGWHTGICPTTLEPLMYEVQRRLVPCNRMSKRYWGFSASQSFTRGDAYVRCLYEDTAGS
jgi:hypothetical protein